MSKQVNFFALSLNKSSKLAKHFSYYAKYGHTGCTYLDSRLQNENGTARLDQIALNNFYSFKFLQRCKFTATQRERDSEKTWNLTPCVFPEFKQWQIDYIFIFRYKYSPVALVVVYASAFFQRSKFESRWRLNFFCKKLCFKRTKPKNGWPIKTHWQNINYFNFLNHQTSQVGHPAMRRVLFENQQTTN